ncbi:unnamed protein product [Gordionus sp. m RMFG-2023]|uniref:tyrosine aminotransferase-like n=1 Tax=Gordionus sp. m RMFG-2023 TaxID=3053472 RepID=UPI0030E22CE2
MIQIPSDVQIPASPPPCLASNNGQDESQNDFCEDVVSQNQNGIHNMVTMSKRAGNCINPIRVILENLSIQPNPCKPLVSLSQGDPSLYNLFPIHDEMKEAVINTVKSGKFNSYIPSAGLESARQAIANQYIEQGIKIDWKNVFLTTGCTQALLWSIECLADKGDNILIPKPCFPIYKTFASMNGIEYRDYDLLPQNCWEINLDHLESLIDSKTKAVIINNPSNPCGSVYSKKHLLSFLKIVSKYNIPVISDEVYAHFVFPGQTYHSIADLTSTVPIIMCNSLSKRYIVPGWRIGWVAIYDPLHCLGQVQEGINRFCQASFGVNSMIQASLPLILTKTPDSYFQNAVQLAYENAQTITNALEAVPGINPIFPQGSMFMMVHIALKCFPEFKNEYEMVERLIQEESVFPFPSSIFGINDYLRISLIVPKDNAIVAAKRMSEFFKNHYKFHNS